MRALVLALWQRSPAAIIAMAILTLAALWIITGRSYGLSILSGSTRIDLTPPHHEAPRSLR